MKTFFIALLVLSTTPLFARSWKTLTIPGAKCGNGRPYKVFYSNRNPDKLFVEFMGGGACWSAATCYGPKLRTWINRIPAIPAFSVMSGEKSKFVNHSMIYFPYCTGDVHAGDHTARYVFNIQVHHWGYRNIVRSLEYLVEKKIIKFEQLIDFVLFGSSAGAIGASLHTDTFEKYLPPNVSKTFLADSIGMHFGKRFWDKFPFPMLNDFHRNFAKIGIEIDESNGYMADQIPSLCNRLEDWNIGFLQGSRDAVMSLGFGTISMDEHEKLVYGKNGVYELTKNIDNCAAWVPSTMQHTFLLFRGSSEMEAGQKPALKFISDVYNRKTTTNYK